jgi:hypothetical protein
MRDMRHNLSKVVPYQRNLVVRHVAHPRDCSPECLDDCYSGICILGAGVAFCFIRRVSMVHLTTPTEQSIIVSGLASRRYLTLFLRITYFPGVDSITPKADHAE